MNAFIRTHKKWICFIGLILIFISVGNSNNVPDMFINRVFIPITNGTSTFYYSTLIMLIVTYICLSGLNKEVKENKVINTVFKRFMATIILLVIFGFIWFYLIQFYKGFSEDLNSIYLDRGNTYIEFCSDSPDKLIVKGNFSIKNCGKKPQKFNIKIKSTSKVKKDTGKDYITLNKCVVIKPKQKIKLDIYQELNIDREDKNLGYDNSAFEYIIFNDESSSIFKGEISDYQIDKNF